MIATAREPPLVVHVVRQFAMGGLENGLVNLINHSPPGRVRHAVVCLTSADRFAQRIHVPDIEVVSLGFRPGNDWAGLHALWRTLRRLRPAVVHSRNLGTVDAALVGWLARAPVRIHGEHGWDVYDLHGSRRRYRLYRRAIAPFVTKFVTVSRDLERWLTNVVGIPRRKVVQIYNGVDLRRFAGGGPPAVGWPYGSEFVIGTVTRFETVKDPLTLARGFVELLRADPGQRRRVRLAMIGDGPLRKEVQQFLEREGVASCCWLPGARDDVPALLGRMNVFALTSRNEGISNTILEAMASGLPIVATAVGGNVELVQPDLTGQLVAPADERDLARALGRYIRDPELARLHGAAARERARAEFGLETMVARYLGLYEQLLDRAAGN
jgi:sugar transferase (PEP-CTERM/EpsH1 system associated)